MASVASRSPRTKRRSMYECRWSWCREVFYNNQTRIQHIIDKHITDMLPDRKGDIQLLRLAQDGVGESMRLYDLEDSERMQSQVSALHSTEARTPVLSNKGLPPFTPEAGSSSRPQDSSPAYREPLALSVPATPSNLRVTPRIHRGGFSQTPVFSSLSSPMQDISIFSIPDSPSFDSLVADATQSQSKHHPWEPPDDSLASNELSRRDSSSTSSGSISFIEKQLTQSPPSEPEPNEEAFLDGPTMAQHAKHDSIPSGVQQQLSPAQSQSAVASIDVASPKSSVQVDLSPKSAGDSSQRRRVVVRQAWYGTLPGHRRKSQTGVRKRPSAIDTSLSKSPSSSQIAGVDTAILHTPRTDAFLRAASEYSQMQNGKHDLTSPLRNDFHPGSNTAEPYSQWTEGPHSPSYEESDPLAFLQTQAPYHSQSQSQA